MAISNPYRPSYGAKDWTARLPPGSPSADPGMAVQPYADPGYGMPNAYVGNLNQSSGQEVGGYLLANQLMGPPNQGQYQSQQNRLAPWSNWGDILRKYGLAGLMAGGGAAAAGSQQQQSQ